MGCHIFESILPLYTWTVAPVLLIAFSDSSASIHRGAPAKGSSLGSSIAVSATGLPSGKRLKTRIEKLVATAISLYKADKFHTFQYKACICFKHVMHTSQKRLAAFQDKMAMAPGKKMVHPLVN